MFTEGELGNRYFFSALILTEPFVRDIKCGECFKGVGLPSDSPSRLEANDEEPNHQIMHALCFGTTDRTRLRQQLNGYIPPQH
jgi:hypothetical protein